MEAALIVSKRMLADYYVKSSSEKEDSRKVLTLEPYETHFGKSNVRQTLELEGSGLATRKVSWLFYPYLGKVVHDASWSGPIKEEQYIKIGKAIAVLAHGTMCYVMFCSFKVLIKDKDYNTVGESVKIWREYLIRVWLRMSTQNYCKCDPLVAIAEGKVKVDQFSTLREHDLCDTIRGRIYSRTRQHKCSAERKVKADQFSKLREHDIYDDRTQLYPCSAKKEVKVLRPWVFPIFGPEWNDISPNEVAIALEMLRNYEPLKLTLELTTEKSYRILDSLVLEALGGVDIQLLRNCLPNTADDVFLAEDVTFACSVLADGLFIGLYELAAMKASAEAVIFPLSDGRFGPFTDEFIEVIKIADHERRMQGDRFISVKHLLFGLSLSSVHRCVEMMLHGRMLDYVGQLASKLSSFSIYKLSRDAATILGDKNVELEHLVLAIFYGKQKNDRTGMDDCSSLFFDEKKWDDYLLKYLRYRDECDFASFNDSDSFRSLLPEDCLSFGTPALCGFSIMDELHKALQSGFKLNAIRG
ncbi:unnamed protein product [Camellia sinensis]